MKPQNIYLRAFIIAVMLFAVSAVSGNGLPRAVSAENKQTTKERWKSIFGPIRARNVFITGVDGEGLARLLFQKQLNLSMREATSSGVLYVYANAEKPSKKVLLSLGVFANSGSALDTLQNLYNRMQSVPPALPGIGDIAFASNTSLLLLCNNVIIRLSVPIGNKDSITALARMIVKELETGEHFAARGKEVKIPKIVSAGLPPRIGIGKEARGNILLEDVESGQALLGIEWEPNSQIGAYIKSGKEPSITFYAPKHANSAGEKKFTLVVASQRNVIATKEFHIRVEKE